MSRLVETLLHKLREDGAALQSRLADLTPEQWQMPVYAEDQAWAARDLLAHLVSAERGHQQLIRNVAGGGDGIPLDFDVDRYNAKEVAQLAEHAPAALLVDLRSVRADTLALVAGLAEEDLARRGRHPALGAEAAVADFVRIIFMHSKLHLRDLNRALSGG